MTGPKPSGPTHPTPTTPPKLAVPAGPVLDEADRILAAEIELHHTGIGEPNEHSTSHRLARASHPDWCVISEAEAATGTCPTCGQRADHVHACAVSSLPRLGGMVRDCEHLLSQALAILGRDLDPASLPSGLTAHAVEYHRVSAGYHLDQALRDLAAIGDLPLPAVGSAVAFPAAAPGNHVNCAHDPSRTGPVDWEMTTVCFGSAVKPARPLPGEEPAPGSAAVLRGAACESTGPVDGGPGAGASPDPSPSVTPVAPGRGVGPGVIGPETPGQAAFAKAVSDAMAREARRPR